MEQEPFVEQETFVVEFSESIPVADRRALLAQLEAYADMHESTIKRFGAEWTLVMGVLKDAAAVAGAVSAVANLASTIIKWRKGLADKGVSSEASIKFEDTPKIDLESISDEALKAALESRKKKGE